MSKAYLGDEVHELISERDALRTEVELVKMNNARLEHENQTQKHDIQRLRLAYEDKLTEAVQLRTILEQMSHTMLDGLERYRRQNVARGVETMEVERPAPKVEPKVEPAKLASGGRVPGPDPYAPKRTVVQVMAESQNAQTLDAPPAFLRRPGTVDTTIVDSRLPAVEFESDDDRLRQLADQIAPGARRQA